MQKLIDFLLQIANSIRSLLGATDKINAQDFPDKINKVYEKGLADGKTDLTELIETQEHYIYQGNNDVLHNALDENGNVYNGVGYKENGMAGHYYTGYIPCTANDVLYFKNIKFDAEITSVWLMECYTDIGELAGRVTIDQFERFEKVSYDNDGNIVSLQPTNQSTVYVRLLFKSHKGTPIITINEAIWGEEI